MFNIRYCEEISRNVHVQATIGKFRLIHDIYRSKRGVDPVVGLRVLIEKLSQRLKSVDYSITGIRSNSSLSIVCYIQAIRFIQASRKKSGRPLKIINMLLNIDLSYIHFRGTQSRFKHCIAGVEFPGYKIIFKQSFSRPLNGIVND